MNDELNKKKSYLKKKHTNSEYQLEEFYHSSDFFNDLINAKGKIIDHYKQLSSSIEQLIESDKLPLNNDHKKKFHKKMLGFFYNKLLKIECNIEQTYKEAFALIEITKKGVIDPPEQEYRNNYYNTMTLLFDIQDKINNYKN